METENKKPENKNSNKKRGNNISIFLGGSFLERFVKKHSSLLILIVFLIIIFISNRYSCMKKLTEIENLTTKLKDVKYENLIISTELTSNSRQSQIEESLKKKGIDLKVSKSSVFEIKK